MVEELQSFLPLGALGAGRDRARDRDDLPGAFKKDSDKIQVPKYEARICQTIVF